MRRDGRGGRGLVHLREARLEHLDRGRAAQRCSAVVRLRSCAHGDRRRGPRAQRLGGARRGRLGERPLLVRAGPSRGRDGGGARRPQPGGPLRGRVRQRDRAEGARVRGLPPRGQAGGGGQHRPLARLPPRHVPRQLRGRERMDGASRAHARGGGGMRRPRVADPGPGAVLARQVGAREVRRVGARDREALRRRRPRVRGACAARRELRGGRARRGGHEAPRRGDGGGLRWRGREPRRSRRDLLPAAERLRVRHRRQARRGVDGAGRPLRGVEPASCGRPARRTTAGS